MERCVYRGDSGHQELERPARSFLSAFRGSEAHEALGTPSALWPL